MVPTLLELEMHHIERMPRQELVEAIRSKQGCLRADLLDRLEEASTDHLQMLLLAARLIQVLRHVRSCR